jgi:hypothetical protein
MTMTYLCTKQVNNFVYYIIIYYITYIYSGHVIYSTVLHLIIIMLCIYCSIYHFDVVFVNLRVCSL